MKKFRTWHDTRIDEIEVVRETAKYVVLAADTRFCPGGERRDAKRSDIGYNYFDTWQEARQFLIDREEIAIIKLLAEVKQHQETLEKIEAMRR